MTGHLPFSSNANHCCIVYAAPGFLGACPGVDNRNICLLKECGWFFWSPNVDSFCSPSCRKGKQVTFYNRYLLTACAACIPHSLDRHQRWNYLCKCCYCLQWLKKSFKPEIQHFVPGETRDPDLGKQTVPTLLSSVTGMASLKRAISFLRCDILKPECMMTLLMRCTSPSPLILCAPMRNVMSLPVFLVRLRLLRLTGNIFLLYLISFHYGQQK